MIPRPLRRLFAMVLPLVLLLAHAGVAPAQSARKRSTPTPTPKASPKPTASPGPGAAASPVAPYVLPDIVATVDGSPIKKKELERLTQAVLNGSGKSIQDLPRDAQKETYASMLTSMVVDKLTAKAAADEKVEPLEIEKRYNALMAQYPKPQDFADQLKKNGQTPDEVKGNIQRQVAQEQWLEKQFADSAKVTPEEIEKFYKEGPSSKFDSPEAVHARHIIVAVRKDAPPEDSYVAEQKINGLAKRIKDGEDFGKVAKEAVEDKSAQISTTDLGYFTRDKIMPEVGEVAFKLKAGEVSAPVRTQFGYHLIKVEDHKTAHTATLDEARDQIVAYLQTQKRQQATVEIIRDLKNRAKVEVFLP